MSREQLSAEPDEVEAEVARTPRRQDARPKSAAQQAAAASAAQERRPDSPPEEDLDPIDGWGNPFGIQMAPGFKAHWVSEFDLIRFGWRRWERGVWGDPRILGYNGMQEEEAGKPVTFRELRLMISSEANSAFDNARDPRRRAHAKLRVSLFDRARESGGVDAVTGQPIPNPTFGFVNQHGG